MRVQRFLQSIKKEIPKEKTLITIDENEMVAPESIKDNILFYQEGGER